MMVYVIYGFSPRNEVNAVSVRGVLYLLSDCNAAFVTGLLAISLANICVLTYMRIAIAMPAKSEAVYWLVIGLLGVLTIADLVVLGIFKMIPLFVFGLPYHIYLMAMSIGNKHLIVQSGRSTTSTPPLV